MLEVKEKEGMSYSSLTATGSPAGFENSDGGDQVSKKTKAPQIIVSIIINIEINSPIYFKNLNYSLLNMFKIAFQALF